MNWLTSNIIVLGGNMNFLFINDNNNWVHPIIIDMYVDLVKAKRKCKESSYNQPFKKG
jgi:hypothetical protein